LDKREKNLKGSNTNGSRKTVKIGVYVFVEE
jgi:hypothetical protein